MGWNASELDDEEINQAIIASLMSQNAGAGLTESNNYGTNITNSPMQSAPDEGELKILREVMKLSELDYLKDHG